MGCDRQLPVRLHLVDEQTQAGLRVGVQVGHGFRRQVVRRCAFEPAREHRLGQRSDRMVPRVGEYVEVGADLVGGDPAQRTQVRGEVGLAVGFGVAA